MEGEEKEVMMEMGSFRLFTEELRRSTKVVLHSRDYANKRKYLSLSHFFRCAVMARLREEEKRLKIRPGRPKNVNNAGIQDSADDKSREKDSL